MTKLFCWGLLTVAVTSGAVYTNDTGGVTYGFRVEFAGPVVITSHSAALPVQSPEGEATALTFSGGEVPPGGSFWLSWRPGDVRVTGYKLLAERPLSSAMEVETEVPPEA
ncbi:MAG: hypothetical protein XD60_1829 [Acetothermia bacterium 64_32]|nr:MAG: hypothetical protein XD60_1829 [Acetothermia bacterium 64_32]